MQTETTTLASSHHATMKTQDQEYKIEFTPERKAELLIQIAAGLLASGHYTRPESTDRFFPDDQLVMQACRKRSETPAIPVVVFAAHTLFDALMERAETLSDY